MRAYKDNIIIEYLFILYFNLEKLENIDHGEKN